MKATNATHSPDDPKQLFIDAMVATIGQNKAGRRENSQRVALAFAEASMFLYGYQVTVEIAETVAQHAIDAYPFNAGQAG